MSIQYLNKYPNSTLLDEKIKHINVKNGYIIVCTKSYDQVFYLDVKPSDNFSADYVLCMIQHDKNINVSKI